MKYEGKFNDIPIYSDPNAPKDTLYFTNKKFKLNPKGVAAYEKSSGFKTDGNVTVEIGSDALFDFYNNFVAAQPKRNGSLKNIEPQDTGV